MNTARYGKLKIHSKICCKGKQNTAQYLSQMVGWNKNSVFSYTGIYNIKYTTEITYYVCATIKFIQQKI